MYKTNKKEIDSELLNTQMHNLLTDLDTIEVVSKSTKDLLKERYSYILECSETLFDLVLSKRFSKKDNKESLIRNIGVILKRIQVEEDNSIQSFDAFVNAFFLW